MSRLYQYPEVTELQENDVMMIDREGNETAKSILASKVAPALMSKTITERGTYKASDDGVRGYNEVNVEIPYTDIHVATGAIATFEGEDLPLKSLTASIVPVQSGSGDPSPSNVRPISGWTEEVITVTDDLQNPTVTNTTTIPFTDGQGQSVEVFGGSVDVVNGSQSVSQGGILLTDLTWSYKSINGVQRICSEPISNIQTPPSDFDLPNIMASCYVASKISDIGVSDARIGVGPAQYSYGRNLVINDSRITSLDDIPNVLSGQKVVYELATPQTIQLTPTSIKSLDGENNVFASTGDVDVEYQTVWVRPTE